jgi:aminoglycoside phosphotransferase (APT) family kinase protein
MLSIADADVVRRDTELPGLARLLDASAMHDLLRRKVPHAKLGRLEQTYLRYKPGTSCLAGYRLEVDTVWVDLYARLVRPGNQTIWGPSAQKPMAFEEKSSASILINEPGLLVATMGYDRRLPQLARILDSENRYSLLQGMFTNLPSLWEGTIDTLRYKPERRYVAQLQIEGAPLAVLKFYAKDQITSHAGRSLQASRLLPLPRKIGRSTRHRCVAFRWRTGQLLSELLGASPKALRMLTSMGIALAELHKQVGGGLRQVSRGEEAGRLRKLANDLAAIHPPLAGRARKLANLLASRLLAALPVYRPIHGDFHPDQILITNKGPSLLDLDEAVLANPARDLGNFLAWLWRDVLRGALNREELEQCEEQMLLGYREGAGRCDPTLLKLYTAVGLFQLAIQPFRQRDEMWPERMQALLSQAELFVAAEAFSGSTPYCQSLSAAQHPSPAASIVIDPFGANDDAKMPWLSEATNPIAVMREFSSRFADVLGEARFASIKAIRVTRYKPQRRCLIEYSIHAPEAGAPHRTIELIGKVRSKGLGRKNYELLQKLWNAGFQNTNEDKISIPEPIGVVKVWNMWFQRKVPGEPATHLFHGDRAKDLARRIADALYKLHATAIVPNRQFDVCDELSILKEKLLPVAHARPDWKPRLEAILSACADLAASLPAPSRLAFIHRDFYPDQVLVHGSQLFLVDFDTACSGDPALDAGNFIGHLIEQRVRDPNQAQAMEAAEHSFTDRYLELSPSVAAESVAGYATLTLARHIALSQQFPSRKGTTPALIDFCEQRLQSWHRAAGREQRQIHDLGDSRRPVPRPRG